MSDVILDVRLDGYDEPIGVLVKDVFGSLAFQYHSEYCALGNPRVLSLSLPISDTAFSDFETRAFFSNLLAERPDAIEALLVREKIEREDIASILFHLGADCAGAISILPQGAPPTKVPGDLKSDYDVLGDDVMDEIVASLHEHRALPSEVGDPSPLAGVMRKIALTRLFDGQFAQPREGSGAPTTHILKISSPRHEDETHLEHLALRLSAACAFDTASSERLTIAGVKCVLVTRYDRNITADGLVLRTHQEDFAQSSGLLPSMKYERGGRDDLKFDAATIKKTLDKTTRPVEARAQFIDATIFDLMIGNNDGHAKNFSILHDQSGAISLAPRYDLVPCRMYDGYTDQLPYNIGEATTLETISSDDFDVFLQSLGIETASARRRLTIARMTHMADQLSRHLSFLEEESARHFADLTATNIRTLFEEFGYENPSAVAGRDTFSNSPAGWAWS